MQDTFPTPPSHNTPRVKLTVALDAPIHAAMTDAARAARRSLVAEINVACDEHLARFGAPTASTQNNEPI